MTQQSLTKLYDALTAEERAVASIAAMGRDDRAEFQRLCDSAPREHWSSPHHSGIVRALSLLALDYQIQQLELLTLFWTNMTYLGRSTGEDCGDEFLQDLAFGRAYMYRVKADAWECFCSENGIRSADLVGGTAHESSLRESEGEMKRITGSGDVHQNGDRGGG